MKLIVALIQPYKMEAIKQALSTVDVKGLTVSEVRGFGRQRGHPSRYRGTLTEAEFVHKLKLEVIVPDSAAALVQETILRNAKTGKVGDGKIFVHALDSVTRIRTGETGDTAV